MLFILITFILTGFAMGQDIGISITVQPPYTPKIITYFNEPNKIICSLMNSADKYAQAVDALIMCNIHNEDNTIVVLTDPKYMKKLKLTPGQIFRVNQNNWDQVIDLDHLVYKGITKERFLMGNIPEGEYKICISAFDAKNNLKSAKEPQDCSIPFRIKMVEPPVILLPVCGQEILVATPQAISFTWTRPPGTPVNAQYNLKIIEILPGTRIPDNAIQTANTPVFFSKDLLINSYLLCPLDPQLVPGNKYVVVVTVFDPAHNVNFRNFGMSASCSFNYVKDLSIEKKKE